MEVLSRCNRCGGLFGYNLGEKTADLAFGPEMPVSPGSRVNYETGKTAMSGLGWLDALPTAIQGQSGGAEYLANHAKAQAKPVENRTADYCQRQAFSGAAEVGKMKGLGDLAHSFGFDPKAGGTFFAPTFMGSRAASQRLRTKGRKSCKIPENMIGATGTRPAALRSL